MAGDPDGGRDDGFTLLEVVVVVVLVAVLASVIVSVVAVIYRTAPTTEARVDDTNSYRMLTTWLPRDAASTPPNAFDFGSTTQICDGATAGASLVQMSWAGGSDTYAVDYRLVPSGGHRQIERHTCRGTSAPYPNTQVLDATKDLFGATASGISDGPDVIGARLTLTTCGPPDCTSAGPTITFEASSRNPGPANTLPPP